MVPKIVATEYSILALSSDQLLRTAYHIVTAATERSDLALQGLTANIINDLSADTNTLHECLNKKHSLLVAGEAARIKRLELGNQLFSMLTILLEKGKACWDKY